MNPAPGDRYRFLGVPDDTGARSAYGAKAPLEIGTEVVVREVVDAGTPGAHDDQEDAVVVEWTATGRVVIGRSEVPYLRPEIQYGDAGLPLLDENDRPKVEMVPRKRVERVLGDGQITRACSIGLTRTGVLPPFDELFEKV